jgi:hypothetical protein
MCSRLTDPALADLHSKVVATAVEGMVEAEEVVVVAVTEEAIRAVLVS